MTVGVLDLLIITEPDIADRQNTGIRIILGNKCRLR